MTQVAVLGTGIMGSAMARNLLEAGLAVTVWDRSPEATAGLAREGAGAAGSAADAVRDASVAITTLPTAAVVESVMFGDHVAEAFAPGAGWAQMGTIGVEATEETVARLAEIRPDLLFVDAPVSGSKGPAEQGQLLILASGPDAAREPLSEPFAAIGRNTVWLGAAGQGSRCWPRCPVSGMPSWTPVTDVKTSALPAWGLARTTPGEHAAETRLRPER
jgi:3-hydroxyisobutyrate dehydrogenase